MSDTLLQNLNVNGLQKLALSGSVSDGSLLLCVPSGWDAYISKEFYEIHENLVAHGWKKVVIDEVDDCTIIEAIGRADVVILWEGYELLERNYSRLNGGEGKPQKRAKRVFFSDDVHYFTPHRREQRARAFSWADLIFATYPDKLAEWYPEVQKNKVRWLPHSASTYFYPRSDSTQPVDNILLSGSRTWPYPFRQFCAMKIPADICSVVDHPGYPGYPGDRANTMQANEAQMRIVGRDSYGDLLRSHPAMLVCGSVFGYLVAKVFEGMATKTLAICDRDSLGSRLAAMGFEEGEHYVSTNILNVIGDSKEIYNAFYQKDPRLIRIAAQASKLISERHTTSVRAMEIHNFSIGLNV